MNDWIILANYPNGQDLNHKNTVWGSSKKPRITALTASSRITYENYENKSPKTRQVSETAYQCCSSPTMSWKPASHQLHEPPEVEAAEAFIVETEDFTSESFTSERQGTVIIGKITQWVSKRLKLVGEQNSTWSRKIVLRIFLGILGCQRTYLRKKRKYREPQSKT